MFRKSDLYLVALLWKMFCNLGDPMSLRHPVWTRGQVMNFMASKRTYLIWGAQSNFSSTITETVRLCTVESETPHLRRRSHSRCDIVQMWNRVYLFGTCSITTLSLTSFRELRRRRERSSRCLSIQACLYQRIVRSVLTVSCPPKKKNWNDMFNT